MGHWEIKCWIFTENSSLKQCFPKGKPKLLQSLTLFKSETGNFPCLVISVDVSSLSAANMLLVDKSFKLAIKVTLCPGENQNFQGTSLFGFGYQWLSVATIDLVGDNREFEVWGIFWAVISIMGG